MEQQYGYPFFNALIFGLEETELAVRQSSSPRSAAGGKENSMYYDQKKCGERIRKLGKMHGFTQEELADKLNVSAGHMGKIETGSKGVSIDLMIEIAETFHVSLDYLVMGKEPATEILRHKIRSMIEFLAALEKSL